MTSRELADITGKQHAHIMRDIRNEIDSLGSEGQSIFGESSYINTQNKEQPCYTFGKDGAMQLALKYDAKTRRKVILKLEELENEKYHLPTGSNLLALAILEANKMLEEKDDVINQQNIKIEADKPKVVFADSVSISKTSILVGDMAKLIRQNGVDIGATRLFKWMREKGFLIKRKGNDWNMPTQKSMDLELFEIKETVISHSDGHTSINKTPKVTGKGQIYFINKFLNEQKGA